MGLIRYAVSACLAGHACRYDGGSNPHPDIMALVEQGNGVPICPEQLAGLPIPRPPCELRKLPELREVAEQGELREDDDRSVVSRDGNDVTAAFVRGAEAALAVALEHGCKQAVLKARSPSCGVGAVYDGSFSKRLVAGNGLWAASLKAAGFVVDTEETWVPPTVAEKS